MNKSNEELDYYANFYKNFILEYKNSINGFLFFYIFSMSISSICVIIINRIYLVDLKVENLNTTIWLIILFFWFTYAFFFNFLFFIFINFS